MVAERNRRASVTEAEGEKRAAILTAEGDRTTRVERAEGETLSSVLKAAESHGDLKTRDVVVYLVALEYMRTLPNIAKDGERVFLPYESSALLGLLGPIQALLQKADLGSATG